MNVFIVSGRRRTGLVTAFEAQDQMHVEIGEEDVAAGRKTGTLQHAA